MGEKSEDIERRIEETRDRIGRQVDALGQKANPATRVGDAVAERRDAISGGVQRAMAGAGDTLPTGADVRDRAQRGAGAIRDNPFALALGAAAAGALIGLLLPSTEVEDDRLGAAADSLKARARETGEEAVTRGQQVAQEASRSATETARQSGREHAAGLQESVRQRADELEE